MTNFPLRIALALPVFLFSAHGYCFSPTTGDFTRDDPTHIRVMSYNVEREYADNSSSADEFRRLLRAVDPDVIVFQEILDTLSVQEVLNQVNSDLPGNNWQIHFGTGSFIHNVVASRFPMTMTRDNTIPEAPSRGVTMGLINLPDDVYATDLYVMGVHFKCCTESGSDSDLYDENQLLRQESADAIINWIRDIQTPGGNITLPQATPLVALGDFNLVGSDDVISLSPDVTLVNGDIYFEETFGSDYQPDWDGSDLTDLQPSDPTNGETFTWPAQPTNSQYPPSRLDRIIYTDSAVRIANSMILNTESLSNAALSNADLQRYDTRAADHYPVFADLAIPTVPQPNISPAAFMIY